MKKNVENNPIDRIYIRKQLIRQEKFETNHLIKKRSKLI